MIWSTILIQNTNWKNVAKALQDLYQATAFLPQKILALHKEELMQVIKSAGFYTRKAQTIINLANYFKKYQFNLELLQEMPKEKLRQEILSLKGIGPETTDVILMYGLRKGEFVVDTYSRRLFSCLGWQLPASYQTSKEIIEANLQNFTLRNYQNFHAMIDTFNQQFKLPTEFNATFLNKYQLLIPSLAK